jgi:hypothetical protein
VPLAFNNGATFFQARPAVLKTSLLILMVSPICNSFLFGFRNKVSNIGTRYPS